MARALVPFLLAGFLVGCTGDVPTDIDVPAPNFGVAGNSGCYTVSGALDQVGVPGGLAGTISGDIEGNVYTFGGPPDFHGWAVHRSVAQTWEITGGIIEPLIGHTLHCENEFRGILRKLPLIRVNTVVRVVEGAQKGNLTLHGTTDLSTVPTSSHLEYHGVICP